MAILLPQLGLLMAEIFKLLSIIDIAEEIKEKLRWPRHSITQAQIWSRWVRNTASSHFLAQ